MTSPVGAEDEAIWARAARHSGRLLVQDEHNCRHVIAWNPPPNRVSAGGLIGYYRHVATCSASGFVRLDYYRTRIHICRNHPCTAVYGASKYGALPPPVAHCRLVAVLDDIPPTPPPLPPPAAAPPPDEGSVSIGPIHVELLSVDAEQTQPCVSPAIPPEVPTENTHGCGADVPTDVGQTALGEDAPREFVPTDGWQPLPPDADADFSILGILARAEAIGQPRQYTGLFDLIAFAAMRKRRLLMVLSEGDICFVSAFAASVIDATWPVEPFLVRVVACRKVGKQWRLAGLDTCTHFYAGVVSPVVPAVAGTSVVSQCLRRGIAAIHTVADGDCGFDVLTMADGSERTLAARTSLRREVRDFLVRNAARQMWCDVWAACQEHQAALPPSFADEEPLGPGRPASSTSAVASAASSMHVGPSTPAPAAGSTASTTSAGPSISADAETSGARPEEPSEGSATALTTAPAMQLARAPADAAERARRQKLFDAVRWGTSLPSPSDSLVLRLAASLSHDEQEQLIVAYANVSAAAEKMPVSTDVEKRFSGRVRNSSSLLSVRLADAAAFAAYVAKCGADPRKRLPYGLMAKFLKENATSPLSRAELQRGKNYLSYCSKLKLSGAVVEPNRAKGKSRLSQSAGLRTARFSARRRRLGGQGRPQKAPLVHEELWHWFCTVKRSVKGRISPGLVMRKARALVEAYTAACLRQGVRADAPVLNNTWLRRWKLEHQVSFRHPNRKWKVPRAILLERLRITRSNVIRVRRLALLLADAGQALPAEAGQALPADAGQDLVMWNFDQSPFHMNEAGSKNQRSLELRGKPERVLKEGHAATRERWTANAMTVSDTTICGAGRIPPLEIMFRVAGSGAVLNPRMRSYIPAWAAPWLTVVTSPTGSYKESDVLTYLETVLPAKTPDRPWMLLLLDSYAAQTTDAVRRLAWERGFVVCIHGGGATGISQPNDTDLHQEMKRLYIELESADAVEQQRLRPSGVPVPRKQDCISWLASIWGMPELHEAAARGFKKVGLANALDGSEDALICREALQFWEELGMAAIRQEVMHDVDVEVAAGRLDWSYESVYNVIVPFPEHGRRFDAEPDDRGSDDGGDHEEQSSDDDGDGPGDAGAVSADAEKGDVEMQPADAGSAPAVSADAERALVLPDHADQAAVSEHLFRVNTLSSVLEQVRGMGLDNLAVHCSNALHMEHKRARKSTHHNAAVVQALRLEREVELADAARRQQLALADREESRRAAVSIRQMRAEAEALVQRRIELQQASTVVECLGALRSFETSDLGQGHRGGGSAEHIRNRMNVLDRIRIRSPPLPPEQANDWHWFQRHWDKARIEQLHPDRRDAWGAMFKNIALDLLERIRGGEHDALSKWMARESREIMQVPALRM